MSCLYSSVVAAPLTLCDHVDGEELPLENGLPLGLTVESTYPETTLSLRPGAQLTILTDGVIEARSASGELFGFERAAAIASQSAEAIAHAAQAFGREDDITVLTLSFAAPLTLGSEVKGQFGPD